MHGFEHLVAEGLPRTVPLHDRLVAAFEDGQSLPQLCFFVLFDLQLRAHFVNHAIVHGD